MWTDMAMCLPSPGLSCGSPYSDVTSASPPCSDSYEPLSPEINFETLQAQYSVHASVNELPIAGTSFDKDSVRKAITPQDVQFYRELQVGTDESIHQHFNYVMAKINSKEYVFLEPENPNSSTPYSDVAQPKKRSKDGAVKRPMNAFMAFSKCERHILALAKTSIHNAVISRHLGKVWKLFPNEGKLLFKVYANSLKQWHQQEYPGYKYRPQKKKSAATARSSGEGKPKPVTKTPKPRNRPRKGAAKAFQPLEVPKAEPTANCTPLYVDMGAVQQGPLYGHPSPLVPQEQTYAVRVLPSYPSDVGGLKPEKAYVEERAVKQEKAYVEERAVKQEKAYVGERAVKQEKAYAENAVVPEQQELGLLTVQPMAAMERVSLHRTQPQQVPLPTTDTGRREPPHVDVSDTTDWWSMDVDSAPSHVHTQPQKVPSQADSVSVEPPHMDLSDIPDLGSMDIDNLLTTMDCDKFGFVLPTEDLVQGNEVLQALETGADVLDLLGYP